MQIVGDKFGHGMDDTHMKLRGAPVLDEPALSAQQKMIADRLTVSELMTVSIVALPPIVKAGFSKLHDMHYLSCCPGSYQRTQ